MRERTSKSASIPTVPGAELIIEPTGIYRPSRIQAILGLKTNTIPRQVRLGHLQISKRAGRHFILGQWLIDWIESGKIQRKRRSKGVMSLNGTNH
jgi:hypothetical protein